MVNWLTRDLSGCNNPDVQLETIKSKFEMNLIIPLAHTAMQYKAKKKSVMDIDKQDIKEYSHSENECRDIELIILVTSEAEAV